MRIFSVRLKLKQICQRDFGSRWEARTLPSSGPLVAHWDVLVGCHSPGCTSFRALTPTIKPRFRVRLPGPPPLGKTTLSARRVWTRVAARARQYRPCPALARAFGTEPCVRVEPDNLPLAHAPVLKPGASGGNRNIERHGYGSTKPPPICSGPPGPFYSLSGRLLIAGETRTRPRHHVQISSVDGIRPDFTLAWRGANLYRRIYEGTSLAGSSSSSNTS